MKIQSGNHSIKCLSFRLQCLSLFLPLLNLPVSYGLCSLVRSSFNSIGLFEDVSSHPNYETLSGFIVHTSYLGNRGLQDGSKVVARPLSSVNSYLYKGFVKQFRFIVLQTFISYKLQLINLYTLHNAFTCTKATNPGIYYTLDLLAHYDDY